MAFLSSHINVVTILNQFVGITIDFYARILWIIFEKKKQPSNKENATFITELINSL